MKYVVGGDFNIKNKIFKPYVQNSRNSGNRLIHWLFDSDIYYVGIPDIPTYRNGYILDFIFSNIPFTQTEVRINIQYGLDYYILITDLPERELDEPEALYYRILTRNVTIFRSLIGQAVVYLPDPGQFYLRELDGIISEFQKV